MNDCDQRSHRIKTLQGRLAFPNIPTENCALAGQWCGRGDLNPHAFRRHPLKMVCLPVPPLPHRWETTPREASSIIAEAVRPPARRPCASNSPGSPGEPVPRFLESQGRSCGLESENCDTTE